MNDTRLRREYDALRKQYDALSRDWHRQRNIEADWRRLSRLSWVAIGVMMIMSAAYVMVSS